MLITDVTTHIEYYWCLGIRLLIPFGSALGNADEYGRYRATAHTLGVIILQSQSTRSGHMFVDMLGKYHASFAG